MRRPRRHAGAARLSLLLIALLALIPVAITAPIRAQPAASVALLRLDDLPTSWSATPSGASPGTGAVGDECDGGPPVVPVSFALAQFQAGPDGPYLIQSVALFTPGDLERAWAYIAADW